MNDQPLPQSVLADMVQLVPLARRQLESVSLPATDTAWQDVWRSFQRCLAWVEYWKAAGDCPELGMLNASMKLQIEATMLDADRLSGLKLLLEYPDQKALLEPLQRYGASIAKSWLVMLIEVSKPTTQLGK